LKNLILKKKEFNFSIEFFFTCFLLKLFFFRFTLLFYFSGFVSF